MKSVFPLSLSEESLSSDSDLIQKVHHEINFLRELPIKQTVWECNLSLRPWSEESEFTIRAACMSLSIIMQTLLALPQSFHASCKLPLGAMAFAYSRLYMNAGNNLPDFLESIALFDMSFLEARLSTYAEDCDDNNA